MKINDNIILDLSKIKQVSQKIVRDYLDHFINLVKKLHTISINSI